MLPIVRVLATVSFAATRLRVSPAAISFLYCSDLPSALMKSHQLTCSHWPKRRSSQLVTNTSSALDEVGELVRRDALAGRGRRRGCGAGPSTRQRLLRVGADPEHAAVRAVAGAQPLAAACVDEVVPDAVGVAGERDAPHRVRDVVVEAGEEAEAVLAGQVATAAGGGAGHRDAARLAAERVALVDGDVEAALDELVGGGEAGHAAAEDGDRLAGAGACAASALGPAAGTAALRPHRPRRLPQQPAACDLSHLRPPPELTNRIVSIASEDPK